VHSAASVNAKHDVQQMTKLDLVCRPNTERSRMSFNVERENRKRAEYLGDFDVATSEIGSRSLFVAC